MSRDRQYHLRREQQCRALAERATDPQIRRRHEELAQLHADRAKGVKADATSRVELSAA